jgi:hypothetical protein
MIRTDEEEVGVRCNPTKAEEFSGDGAQGNPGSSPCLGRLVALECEYGSK